MTAWYCNLPPHINAIQGIQGNAFRLKPAPGALSQDVGGHAVHVPWLCMCQGLSTFVTIQQAGRRMGQLLTRYHHKGTCAGWKACFCTSGFCHVQLGHVMHLAHFIVVFCGVWQLLFFSGGMGDFGIAGTVSV